MPRDTDKLQALIIDSWFDNYLGVVSLVRVMQGEIKAGPGAKVDNITIQKVCRNDKSEHLSLPYSKNVAQIILNKLDPSDQRRILCYNQSALFGNTQLIG